MYPYKLELMNISKMNKYHKTILLIKYIGHYHLYVEFILYFYVFTFENFVDIKNIMKTTLTLPLKPDKLDLTVNN